MRQRDQPGTMSLWFTAVAVLLSACSFGSGSVTDAAEVPREAPIFSNSEPAQPDSSSVIFENDEGWRYEVEIDRAIAVTDAGTPPGTHRFQFKLSMTALTPDRNSPSPRGGNPRLHFNVLYRADKIAADRCARIVTDWCVPTGVGAEPGFLPATTSWPTQYSPNDPVTVTGITAQLDDSALAADVAIVISGRGNSCQAIGVRTIDGETAPEVVADIADQELGCGLIIEPVGLDG